MAKLFFGLALVLALIGPASAQSTPNYAADCVEGNQEAIISGCSGLIETGMLFGKPITDSDLAVAYNNRGNAYREGGQFKNAFTDLNEALRLNPGYDIAFYNRGLTYFDTDQLDDAVADYDRSIQINPDNINALNNRGNTYRLLGRYDEALADFQAVFILDPKFKFSYFNRGLTYEEMGNFEQAILDYRRAQKLDPTDQDIIDGLTRVGYY